MFWQVANQKFGRLDDQILLLNSHRLPLGSAVAVGYQKLGQAGSQIKHKTCMACDPSGLWNNLLNPAVETLPECRKQQILTHYVPSFVDSAD